jgi:hypothetical protein
VLESTGSVSHTFTIYNVGESTLNLSGSPVVSVLGSHASDFTVTAQPTNQIRPAGSSTFTVVFDPSAVGLRTASISIANNDLNENPFNFAIQGTGFNYPRVVSIERAGISPTSASSVDFNVTFSESVTGVDISDFSLSTTGLTSASLITVSGSGANYVVSADTGTGDGTIRLNLIDNNSIQNLSGDLLGGPIAGDGSFTIGETYTVDKSSCFTVTASIVPV